MALDVKELIEKAVDKLKNDSSILEKFQKEPVKTLEELLNIDLPDDKVETIINGIKLKLGSDKASDIIKGIGGLFGKK